MNEYDYWDFYKSSFANAISKSAIVELEKCAINLNNRNGLTGNDIRKAFCDCLESMNDKYKLFVDNFQRKFDETITSKISDVISVSIKRVFETTIVTEDVSIHLSIPMYSYTHNNFVMGGCFYKKITNIIKTASGRWNFTFDKVRDNQEQARLVNGTNDGLFDYFNSNFGDKVEYTGYVNKYAKQIKDVAIAVARRVFDEKDVIRSTFVR